MSIMNIFQAASFGPPLVLRRYRIDENNKLMIDIVGRKSGIGAWLLTSMGLEVETSLRVTRQILYFKSASFFGMTYNTVPLSMIASTHCGYTKSAFLLIAGVLITLFGIFNMRLPLFGVMAIIVGIAFLVSYWLSKKLTIYIETTGGMVIGLSFRRSIIENVAVDIDQALKATQLINKQVLYTQSRGMKQLEDDALVA